jgi:hypothetical protein
MGGQDGDHGSHQQPQQFGEKERARRALGLASEEGDGAAASDRLSASGECGHRSASITRQLDAFINPLVYTFQGNQGPSIMTMTAALRNCEQGQVFVAHFRS